MPSVCPIRQRLKVEIRNLKLENAVPPYLQAGFWMQPQGVNGF